MSRYVVTELEGYLSPDSNGTQRGLSVHVIDTTCHRLVATWRSEDYRQSAGCTPREQIRTRAERTAAALTEGRRVPRITTYRKSGVLHVIER